ncbi:MAG: RNA polymerase subunit sigma-70 [Pirellula sp.]|nr:RNA polymerase subunit sigma-70 [Pirellula sp.]
MNDAIQPPPPSADFLAQVTQAQRSMYAFILSLVWRPADADDVLQETNLVLWRKAAEFDARQNFMPWALRIAQLQAMAHFKKQRRRPLLDDGLLSRLAEESIAEQDEINVRRQALSSCLQKLSEDHRTLIAKRYEPEASVNEMASERGISPKSLSEKLRRIRALLLECVDRTVAVEMRE